MKLRSSITISPNVLTVVILFFTIQLFAGVTLPKLISDGMILQRGTELKIWGWAASGEKVSLVFAEKEYSAIANRNGEWNDIHPVNKKPVGDRLALLARKMAYGDKDIVSSGPLWQSMKIQKDSILIPFKNTGSGLILRGDKYLNCIAIAGFDKKFVCASAKIINNTLVVWSDKVPNPIAVRYAWADNLENANLYNKEGLPASPFRTDNW